jgi:pullulanase
MNNLAAAFYLTSQGMPFVHAGEELLREKLNADGSRNHNSYNSSDEVNHIEWSNLEKDTYRQTSAYYQGLIAFRKAHPALRMTSAQEVEASITTLKGLEFNVSAFQIAGGANGDEAQGMIVIFNPRKEATEVTLPEGKWNIYIDAENAGTEVLGSAEGTVSVAPISAMVLVLDNAAVETQPAETTEATEPTAPEGDKGGVNIPAIAAGVAAVAAAAGVAAVVLGKRKK